MRVVKLLHELAGRIVNDRAVSTRIDLAEHLANDAGLASSGIAYDQKVLILCVTGDAQRAPGIIRCDADSVAANGLREAFGVDKKWPLETASVAQRFATFDVFWDGDGEQQPEDNEPYPELRHKGLVDGGIAVDEVRKPRMEILVGIPHHRATNKKTRPVLCRRGGQLKWQRTALDLERCSGLHVSIECRSPKRFVIR